MIFFYEQVWPGAVKVYTDFVQCILRRKAHESPRSTFPDMVRKLQIDQKRTKRQTYAHVVMRNIKPVQLNQSVEEEEEEGSYTILSKYKKRGYFYCMRL